MPTRHYLGAALLESGNPSAAADVYLQDLTTYPDNGWSLFGLALAQQRMGQADAARATQQRQAAAWQWADAPLTASRY